MEFTVAMAHALQERINVSQRPQMLGYFKFSHLPEKLQQISSEFARLAVYIDTLPNNPESTTALRKLLEAKDCAVRSELWGG